MRFHYLDWGTRRPAARAVPARRRPQRPHLGPRLRRARAASGTAWPSISAVTARASGRRRWTTPPRATPPTSTRSSTRWGSSASCWWACRWAARTRWPGPGSTAGGWPALVLVDVGPEVRAEGVRKIAAFTSEADAARFGRAVRGARAGFNPRRNRELLRRSLLHNLRRMPDGRFMWKYDQRHRGRALDPAAASRAGASSCGRRWTVSRVRRSSCAAPRATSSTTRTPSGWPAACRQGRWVKVEGAGHTVQGDNPAGLLVELRAVPGRGYGLISVVARLMTNASRRSKKSATISVNASARSAAMAGPAA